MRIVLTGATGRIGSYLREPLIGRGWEVAPWSAAAGATWGGAAAAAVDLADPDAIADGLTRADPDAVVHLAAMSDAEAVRRDPDRARVVNVEAVASVAEWCERNGRRLVFTSTDMVFPGTRAFSTEADEPGPVLAYGESKRAAERAALAASDSVVARICLLYGPTRNGRETFFDHAVAALRAGEPRTFFDDEFRTPLDYATAAEVLARLVESPYRGLLHVGGPDRMSRHELMTRVARGLRLDESLVRPNSRADASFAEPRPADVSLETSRLVALFPDLERPPVEEAVRRMSR
ncbi:sugar nucleotide-binding protein [Paludisphaera sp.]|uniref:SDR family oxidoreductase n=1 Tax=Paludisphaera sp. TaxID=2017432 RepID=UPI00301DA698